MNKAKIREEIKKLNPIYDLMFRKMAEEKDFCEEMLRLFAELFPSMDEESRNGKEGKKWMR